MWHSYFFGLQRKYSVRVSSKTPLVIRLDGKDVTKNTSINTLVLHKGSFLQSFNECARYFTDKFGGYAIFGSDEISFIFTEPKILFSAFASETDNSSNEIISLFSQYFFDYFNNMYDGEKLFFHAKCFSILENKIASYVKHRMRIITNVNTTKFLIANNNYTPRLKLKEMIKMCENTNGYSYFKDIIKGTMYCSGKKINLEEFLKGNIKEIKEFEKEEVDFDIEV